MPRTKSVVAPASSTRVRRIMRQVDVLVEDAITGCGGDMAEAFELAVELIDGEWEDEGQEDELAFANAYFNLIEAEAFAT
jgi:hypothetical protein